MPFERCQTKNRKISLKPHIQYFNFRSKIPLDHHILDLFRIRLCNSGQCWGCRSPSPTAPRTSPPPRSWARWRTRCSSPWWMCPCNLHPGLKAVKNWRHYDFNLTLNLKCVPKIYNYKAVRSWTSFCWHQIKTSATVLSLHTGAQLTPCQPNVVHDQMDHPELNNVPLTLVVLYLMVIVCMQVFCGSCRHCSSSS